MFLCHTWYYNHRTDSVMMFSGKPSPSLMWYRGRRIIDESYEIMSPLIIRNELMLPQLQRRDLMATLTCQAANNDISTPAQTSITLDMNCKYYFRFSFLFYSTLW